MNRTHQVVVITGAASGIGLALTKAYLKAHYHVVMADNAVTALCDEVEQLSQEAQTEVLGVVCDVSKYEQVKSLARQTFEHFGRVDILINNAGVSGYLAPLWELTHEHIRKVMDINLHGAIHCVQVFLPLLFEQSFRSHIVNMASVYGLCSGSRMAAYAMSKQGIVALSESMYFDLIRMNKNVDVSVVCPSFVNTNLLTNSAPICGDKWHEMLSSLIERSRPAEDVAAHIIREVEKKTFYILPDREVKGYVEDRLHAILNQTLPNEHNLEKILTRLSER